MFYNTGDATHTLGKITISGGATANLSAPSSGTYSNLLFFQDRTRGTTSIQNTISGGSTANFSGVLYFPTTMLTYSGGSSTSIPSVAIVADKLTVSASSWLQDGLNASGGVGARVALIQ